MTLPDFSFEDAARDRGHLRIAGVDEVGRGPRAVAACVGEAIGQSNVLPGKR